MTYAVKTVKNLFTYGHERYTMMTEYENDFLFIRSYMDGDECSNVLWYSYWRTQIQADPQKEKMYIIYNSSHNSYGEYKKNQRIYNNQFGWYNSYRNNLLQHKVAYECFIDFVSQVVYIVQARLSNIFKGSVWMDGCGLNIFCLFNKEPCEMLLSFFLLLKNLNAFAGGMGAPKICILILVRRGR